MIIQKVDDDRSNYLDLLLLADPDIKLVKNYMYKGDLFGVYDDELVCCALVLDINSDICELKNIATYEEHQRKGYARALIEYLTDYYKSIYSTMIVGTANSSFQNISFYTSCGFKYYKTIDNFFIDNYTEKIFEDEVQCIDMLYFKKHL